MDYEPYVSHNRLRMTQTTGVPATKHDPIVSQLPVDIDQQQSIDLLYEIGDRVDIRQINRVYGDCIEIEYPVKSINSLDDIRLIESQFAAHNAVDDIDRELIDEAIKDVIPVYLEQEEETLPEDPILAARVSALIFGQTRELGSTKNLLKYFRDNPSSRQAYGLDINHGLSESTLSKARTQYGLNKPSVQNAIRRLKHALYRNGLLTETLSGAEYTVNQAIPLGESLPDDLRYRALVNYCDLLLAHLTEDISFNRAENAKYSIREIIAALAKWAVDGTFNKGERRAQLQFQDDLITYSRFRQVIRDNIAKGDFYQSKQRINRIGTKLCQNLIQFADEELDFFSTPLDLTFDPTWIPIDEGAEPEDVPGAMGTVKVEENGGFYISTGVSFTPMSRLSFGVDLLTEKSALPKSIWEMIALIEDVSEIGWILADREFNGAEIIDLFRTAAEETWIIRLKNHRDIVEKEEYHELQKDGQAVISIDKSEVNAFWKEIDRDSQRHVLQEEDDEFMLISGMPMDKTTISQLAAKYPDRWSAETHIRQLKHDHSPEMAHLSGLEQTFILNIASAFYNIHKIISQSVSPNLGLPLQPKHYDVLTGIIESTFARRPQPHI